MHKPARAVHRDPLVDIRAILIFHARGIRPGNELGAQAIGVFYRADALVRREMLFGRIRQAIRASDLAHDPNRHALRMKRAYGLQGVRALVRQIHATTRVDKSHLADLSPADDGLQLLPARVKMELVIHRDLGFRSRGKIPNRTPILALNRYGLLHQHRGNTRVLCRLKNLQPHARRRVHMHEVRLFPFKHLPVIHIPPVHAKRIAECVQLLCCARGNCGEFSARDTLIRLCQPAGAPATHADDRTFEHISPKVVSSQWSVGTGETQDGRGKRAAHPPRRVRALPFAHPPVRALTASGRGYNLFRFVSGCHARMTAVSRASVSSGVEVNATENIAMSRNVRMMRRMVGLGTLRRGNSSVQSRRCCSNRRRMQVSDLPT